MSPTARRLGLTITLVMLVFSSWMYWRTGDWIALLFVAGSIAYALFFFSTHVEDGS